MPGGFIQLPRAIAESAIWNSKKPFDERSAYIDLMLQAAWKEHDVATRSGYQRVKPGQVFASMQELAKRWNWTKSRVYRFLRCLNRNGDATVTGTPDATVIALANTGFLGDQRNGKRNGKVPKSETLAKRSEPNPYNYNKASYRKKGKKEEIAGARVVDALPVTETESENLPAEIQKTEGMSDEEWDALEDCTSLTEMTQ